MEINFKRMFIFIVFLSILTLSTVHASDINLEENIQNDNTNIETIEETNLEENIQNDNFYLKNINENNNPNLEKVEENNINENNNPHLEKVEESSPNLNTMEMDDSEIDNVNVNSEQEIIEPTNIKQKIGVLKSTTEENNDTNNTLESDEDNSTQENQSVTIKKTTPRIFIESIRLKSRDTLTLFLKNSDNTTLKNKRLTLLIDNRTYRTYTNNRGVAKIKLFLTPKTYRITVQFNGDQYLNNVSRNFKIRVSKLSTFLRTYANYIVRKKRLYIYLFGMDGEPISNRKVILKYKKRTYIKTTNKNGRVGLKISSPAGRHSISIKFKGDKYFYRTAKKLKFYITKGTHFIIGNNKLLKNGYLRIYLKDKNRKAIRHKRMTIIIGGKRYRKRTSADGIIVLRPNLKVRNYTVKVKYGRYSAYKILRCLNDTIKDPMKHNISLVGGAPDLDYMPGNYVMGDGSATYTLKRAQYREVLIRDSYCLFLNNKLSKYVFFKTKNHPKLNYVIKREKWNVIEREINKKLVKKNKNKYWPREITVSLKGKAYKYSEVRDVQDTIYTCGPTSASVCTQVLRNYVCEKQLAKLAKTNREGTKIPKLEKALKKYNFTCTYFYRNSFDIGLAELKKGGCALVFHAQNHYVSILDISKNGKKVLVSNSYKSYDNIPTKWIKVSYMRKKFGHFDDSLVIRLNYTLSESKKNSINCFYNSMGRNWYRHGIHSKIGRV